MARYNEFAGPKLPTQLLEKVYGGKVDKHGKRESSRKEKRKAERQAKKKAVLRTKKPVKWQAVERKVGDESESEDEVENVKMKSAVPAKDAKPVKSILKKRPEEKVEEKEDVFDDEEEDEAILDDEKEDEDISEDDDEDINTDDFTVSRAAAKAKLDDDDAAIAMLEAKLGMKGKKKSNKITEDDWDFLINGDLGGEDDEEEDEEDEEDDQDEDLGQITGKGKRKRGKVSGKSAADDEWLQNKRKKAKSVEDSAGKEKNLPVEGASEEEEGAAEAKAGAAGDDMDGLVNPFSDDEMSADDFNSYEDSEDEDEGGGGGGGEGEGGGGGGGERRQRENPYIAPPTSNSTPVAKYIPPSLRKPSSSDEELLSTIRRQAQGHLNRLSEANLVSILQSVLEMYSSNPRQHVTSILVSLLTTRIADPAVLNDTFLILHAGFSTALYRSLGPDFGAQLLESIVNTFDQHYNPTTTTTSAEKQPLNLLAFLSTLYTLQATSHQIIFDYIRTLLSTFSTSTEPNTELLLRIIRTSGPQLRSDDPSALKDIVLILQRETSNMGGETNLSVRTKFMIETILNLKNNRVKTGVAAKAMSAEHMLVMKKILGGVKGVKTTEPLRITLADIRDAEKKGKWWLVGASWKDPAKHDISSSSSISLPPVPSDPHETDNEAHDLETLARQQGMNTSIRSALFIAIVGALDPPHAQIRIGKLGLKKTQYKELPRVLLHCAGMEKVYNHFYTCVALLFPAEAALKKAWVGSVGDLIRRLEQQDDGDDGEVRLEVRQIYSWGKMLGCLIAEGALSITILRNLEFGDLNPKSRIFVQVLFTTLFVSLRKLAAQRVGKGKGEEFKERKREVWEGLVKGCFEKAFGVPDMVLGLQFAVEKVVRGAKEGAFLGGEKEGRVVEEGCGVVMEGFREGPRGKGVRIEDDDGGDDFD